MGIRQNAELENKIRYNSGKLCKQGHSSDRLVSTGKCIKCARLEDKKLKKFRKYGISDNQYWELFWKQNGKCAICRNSETVIDPNTKTNRALSVDHCHDTNIIRGLLCQRCNIGIGHLSHDPELLRLAALYCERIKT